MDRRIIPLSNGRFALTNRLAPGVMAVRFVSGQDPFVVEYLRRQDTSARQSSAAATARSSSVHAVVQRQV